MPALIQWSPQWRSDQKDMPEREIAAEAGIRKFLQESRCFASYVVQRGSVSTDTKSPVANTRIVTITVRELGPVLKILSSPALIEGGTEVVLDIVVQDSASMDKVQKFTVRWANGGAGVVKGVASLPDDMAAALTAALKP